MPSVLLPELLDVAVVHPPAQLEPAGPPAGVDVLDEVPVERVRRHAARGRQSHQLRVVDRELGELVDDALVDDELVAVPEVDVVAEHLGEGDQERCLQERSSLAVGHPADAPGLVDDVEEEPDVLDERGPTDVVHDLLQAVGQLDHVGARTGAGVTVEPPDHLDEGRRGEQVVATAHLLLPADLVREDEGLAAGELVERVHRRHGHPLVAQGHVAGEAGLTDVEVLEALALPLLVRPEVDDRSQVGDHLAGLVEQHLLCGRDPLQAVHDVDGVLQVEAAADLTAPLASHAEVDVRHSAAHQRLLELADLLLGEDLALVVVDLEEAKAVRIDDTAQDDLPLRGLVEGGVDHLHAFAIGHDGWVSFR